MTTKQQTGDYGEYLARTYLREAGYRIDAANWRCPIGELDIIARIGVTLVFVEVRTRRDETTESALASITPAKRTRLINAVYAYLAKNEVPEGMLWRVDVIGVALAADGQATIDHVEDALGW